MSADKHPAISAACDEFYPHCVKCWVDCAFRPGETLEAWRDRLSKQALDRVTELKCLR